MPLLESLLAAIVRVDGDALVMHAGDKPYVVASAGPIALATHGLNLQSLGRMMVELIPAALHGALDEFGAVEHELPWRPQMGRDRFTVVVAGGGDDLWIEVRRHRRSRVAESTGLATETGAAAAAMTNDVAGPRERSPGGGSASAEPPGHAHRSDAATAQTHIDGFGEATRERPAPSGEGPAAASAAQPVRHALVESPFGSEHELQPNEPGHPAEIIPMTRVLRVEGPSATRDPASADSGVVPRLLTVAAARGATALYLTTDSAPFLRIDDDVRPMEGEPPLSAPDVEAGLLQSMPETLHQPHARGESVEWVTDFAGVGRVRTSTFRDSRGPGAVLQLITLRPVTADRLGLASEIRSLAMEPDGLVLVAGSRGQGKTTLIGALVDVINRGRTGFVLTLERQVQIIHDRHAALVSQRELPAAAEQMAAAIRLALRENPDVLAIDEISSAETFRLALDAAGSGRLVLASLECRSVTDALARAVEWFPPEERPAVHSAVGERLRGVVFQMLLRKAGGGRIAAREVAVTTGAVAQVIAEGRLQDLPSVIDRGRAQGLVSLTESLVQLARNGTVDLREAYRKAHDREAFVAALQREHVDLTALERFA